MPPVVSPERVAEEIVGLALRPRRSVRVGASNAALSVPFALAPDMSGRLVGGLAERFLFRTGPPAPANDGGLFETVPGEAAVRGDWGLRIRARARRAIAFAALSAVLLSRIRQAAGLARARRG